LQSLFNQLQAQHDELSAIIESMAEGVLVLDRRLNIRLANTSFRSLFTVNGEVEGRNYIEVVRFAPLKEIITSYDTLQEAVESAYNNAVQGDIVLLSPACASYDMFKNYEYRGLAFKDAVKSLTKLIADK